MPGALPGSGVFGQMLCLRQYLTLPQIENSLSKISKDKSGEYIVHILMSAMIDSIDGVLLQCIVGPGIIQRLSHLHLGPF